MKALFWAKVKLAAACIAVTSLLAGGAGIGLQKMLAQDAPGPPTAARAPQPPSMAKKPTGLQPARFEAHFETGDLSELAHIYRMANPLIKITDEVAHSGRYSVQISGAGDSRARLHARLNQPLKTIHVRLFFYIRKIEGYIQIIRTYSDDYISRVTISPSYVRLQLPPPCPDGETTFACKLETERWYCLEMRHMRDKNGEARVWLDGREVITRANVDTTCAPEVRQAMVGLVLCNAPADIYIDDFVVDTQYVGTDDPGQKITNIDKLRGKSKISMKDPYEVNTLKLANEVRDALFSPDGKKLAGIELRGTVRIWDTNSWQQLKELKHTHRTYGLAWSPDGRMLACSGWDGNSTVWDPDTGNKIHYLQNETKEMQALAFSPDSSKLALLGRFGEPALRIWDSKTGTQITSITHGANLDLYGVYKIRFSPDGKYLAFGSWEGSSPAVKILEINTWKIAENLSGHDYRIRAVAFSPDGMKLASGSGVSSGETPKSQKIMIWDTKTWRKILLLEGHEADVNCLAFSPDGKILASASEDKTVKIWEIMTGKEIYTYKGHEWGITSVEFSSDGKYMATGSRDGTIKIWKAHVGIIPSASHK